MYFSIFEYTAPDDYTAITEKKVSFGSGENVATISVSTNENNLENWIKNFSGIIFNASHNVNIGLINESVVTVVDSSGEYSIMLEHLVEMSK